MTTFTYLIYSYLLVAASIQTLLRGTGVEAAVSVVTKVDKKLRFYHKYNVQAPFELPSWGTYCPGNYFAMKRKNAPPNLLSGIMWTTSELLSRRRIRHMAAQDELENFSWIRHDGRGYGQQELHDRDGKVDITTAFAVNTEEAIDGSWSWMQRFDVQPRQVETLFMFYFGVDCDGVYDEDLCMSMSGLIDLRIVERPVALLNPSGGLAPVKSMAVVGRSESGGVFCLELNLYAEENNVDDDNPVMTHWATSPLLSNGVSTARTVSSAIDKFKDEAMDFMNVQVSAKKRQEQPIYDEELDLPNTVLKKDAGNSVFQIRSEGKFRLESILHENIQSQSVAELVPLVTSNR
jgi:hypothetical protein